MRKRLVLLLCYSAILSLVLAYNACGQNLLFKSERSEGGSGVGNPMQSKSLLSALCEVVQKCHAKAEASACETGVMSNREIAVSFGLPKETYPTFASIVSAEAAGILTAESTAVNSCLAAIRDLSCSDPLVRFAYDATSSDPFVRVAFMVPTTAGSCPAVYSEPPGLVDYFVSPAGNDTNDGSKDRPWATITHAASAVSIGSVGATVHVAPGEYVVQGEACSGASGSCGVHTAKSGTPAARLKFVSDIPGAAKIISNGAASVWYNSGEYVDIVGFEVIGDSVTDIGIQNSGSHVRVTGNHVRDIPVTHGCSSSSGGGGIRHTDRSSTDNETTGNLIHDIGPRPGDGLAASNYCNVAHGIFYSHAKGTIANNRIYRVATFGVATWFDAADLRISNNLIFASGARIGSGAFLGGGINIAAGEGASGAVHKNTVVFNNIIRNNSGYGIAEYGATGANTYVKNVIFSNGVDLALATGASATGTLSVDPQMVDFKLDGSGDYHLMSGSPAIDAGTLSEALGTAADGFLRPYGNGVDIGPYEWHP